MQNETAQTKLGGPDKGPPYSRNPQDEARSIFLGVWGGLTKFDRGSTEALTGPKTRFGLPPLNHWIEHIESLDSVLYRLKTDEK